MEALHFAEFEKPLGGCRVFVNKSILWIWTVHFFLWKDSYFNCPFDMFCESIKIGLLRSCDCQCGWYKS